MARVHLEVEWLDGDKLDDDTLFEIDDLDALDMAVELGCIMLSSEDDETEASPFTLINVSATKLIRVTPLPEPSDAAPVDAV